MYKHCIEKGNGLIEVKFNHKVLRTGQDEKSAWVDVEVGKEGEVKETQRITADYLIGCDGGSSTVRKSLYGRNWPGQTFDFRLMVQNVCYPLPREWSFPVLLETVADLRSRSGTTASKNTAGTAATIWSTPKFGA